MAFLKDACWCSSRSAIELYRYCGFFAPKLNGIFLFFLKVPVTSPMGYNAVIEGSLVALSCHLSALVQCWLWPDLFALIPSDTTDGKS